MKNSTLIFRSLALVIFIAGGAHLFSYLSYAQEGSSTTQTSGLTDGDRTKSTGAIAPEGSGTAATEKDDDWGNSDRDLSGLWKVTYNTEDFKGGVVYRMALENGVYKAYTHEYQDTDGNGQKAEGALVLVVHEVKEEAGNGTYSIEYEGKKYDVEALLKWIDDRSFALTYDYYGYGDTETWKKL